MPRKDRWYEAWWGLLSIIVLFLIIAVFIIIGLISIINTGKGTYVGIGLGVLSLIILTALIFSEGFRSFVIRIFSRR
jgi:hypothetical protein